MDSFVKILADPESMKKFLKSIDMLVVKLKQLGLSDLAKKIGNKIDGISNWTSETCKKLIEFFEELLKKQSIAWKIGSIICGIIGTLICMASIYDDLFSKKRDPNQSYMKSIIKSGAVVVGTTMGGVIGHLCSPVIGIGYGMFVGAMIGAGIKWLIS